MPSVKTSLSEPMQFQITAIEFDFEDTLYPITEQEQDDVYDEVIGSFWSATDEDDLIDEISTCTGWCIKSIDYRNVLK